MWADSGSDPWRSRRRHGGTGRGPGAAIQAVQHAVAVLVAGAPQGIHGGATRCVGAAVEAIGDPVPVAVLGAAARVHQHARRGVRAPVEPIGDVVAVGVLGTAPGIHRGPGHRRRATVDAVGHAVAVAVAGAAVGVDGRTRRRVGAAAPDASRSFLPLALYYLSSGALGRFGNGGTIDFPLPIYAFAGLLTLIALVGLVRLWLGRAAQPTTATTGTPAAPVAWHFWALHVWTVIVVVGSVLYFAVILNAGATGKYQFPAFPSFAILLGAGALAWFRPRWHGWVAAAVLLLMAAASVYALFGLLWPSYGPPRQPLQS